MPTSVLVVDDAQSVRWVMRTILEDAGYAVYEASDGKPALTQLADSQQGMVVLLDVQMPGMDGFAVLRTLAEDEQVLTRHAYILVTAQDHRALRLDVAKLLTRLGIRVLAKPFDVDDLLAAVLAAEQRLAQDPLPLPPQRARHRSRTANRSQPC